MKNWIFYKSERPINTGECVSLRIEHDLNGPVIRFFSVNEAGEFCTWHFNTELERDLVYEKIKSQMTEIKLDYHPDLENE